MNLNALGALMFGNLALAFIGAVAIVFGGPFTITLAALAMLCAYAAQLFFYAHDTSYEGAPAAIGTVLWVLSVLLAAISGISSVWF